VVIIDQAEGMSAAALRTALEDIAGDRSDLTGGMVGRNLFGRGLSDVMRAHSEPMVQSYDGSQLTIAKGEWRETEGWVITMDDWRNPPPAAFEHTFLDPGSTGTAVRFIVSDRKRCHISDPPDICYRLANFYMLRLIASDPNVELLLRQSRAKGSTLDRIEYDFPVGQVIARGSTEFDPGVTGLEAQPLEVDFLVVRSDTERGLRGPSLDRDARENGLLIVDELDAVYDLTFADPDYEKADFLSRIYGIVRITGLRQILESYLNADPPTSPLRPDREGFSRAHEFSQALLDFVAEKMRPVYERERQLADEKQQAGLSKETRRRIDQALQCLNRYFHQITELSADGAGPGERPVPEPTQAVTFFPQHTKLVAGQARHVLLLIRDNIVANGAEVIVAASEDLDIQPETERIDFAICNRWSAHRHFFALRFTVSSSVVGHGGKVEAAVETKDGSIVQATLEIDDVLAERQVPVPETMAFLPDVSTGRPGRRNNLMLYVNPVAVPSGHHVRIQITKRTGDIALILPEGSQRLQQVDIKLDKRIHAVRGQELLRVLIPWSGTSWNQRAHVLATAKVGGGGAQMAEASIRIDEPQDSGFFKDVKYGEIDPKAPSQFAAGIITVNVNDSLNRFIFGDTKEDFDERLLSRVDAQQRLAGLLLEEASFRALQQRYDDNKVHFADRREIASVHEEIDRYKYESAVDVHKALARSRS